MSAEHKAKVPTAIRSATMVQQTVMKQSGVQQSDLQQDRQDSMVARIAAIFACFTPEQPAIRLSDVARQTGLPVSTVSRIVSELVQAGLLARDEHKMYMVGPRIVEMAQSALPLRNVREVASALLDELCARTNMHIQLAALDGGNLVVLDRRDGKQQLPVYYHIGDRIPLVPTANGRIMLAYAPSEVVQSVLNGGNFIWPVFDTPRPSVQEVLDSLEQVRHEHKVVLTIAGAPVHSIAMPIVDKTRRVIASLAIVFLPHTADLDQLSELLRACTLGISKRLRGPLPHRELPPWGFEGPNVEGSSVEVPNVKEPSAKEPSAEE